MTNCIFDNRWHTFMHELTAMHNDSVEEIFKKFNLRILKFDIVF